MTERQLLAATHRPSRLVGRSKELDTIRRAIFDSGDSCRLVLIRGKGGMGKTRLLEEVMRLMGNQAMQARYPSAGSQPGWEAAGTEAFICDLLDLTDIRLHSRQFFIDRLGDSLRWGGKTEFHSFEVARARRQRMIDFGAAYAEARSAAAEAEAAFWQDYRELSQQHRLVIPVDTTEQLAIISSEWLLDRGLLQPEDLVFYTQQWLLAQIRLGRFRNTTLIFAGRDEEGGPYFNLLRQASAAAEESCEEIDVLLEAFYEKETRQYFQGIYDDSARATPDELEESTKFDLQSVLDILLTDDERLKVLWHYTGGQPIRLALYTDVLVEGRVPEPLQDESLAAALERTGNSHSALTDARKEIEKEFIQVLFGAGSDLRPRIMRSLARATRGLSAEQLHFVLDSEPGDSAETWQARPSRIAEIKNELNRIQTLSIVKYKPGGRIGLQDEVYRIYTEVMSGDEDSRRKETTSRRKSYKRLREWANAKRLGLAREKETHLRDNLARIRVERPDNILSSSMPSPTPVEERRRLETLSRIQEAELEYLHYALLLDPAVNFNDTYYNMANSTLSAFDESEGAMLQSETWRVLHDDYAFRFIQLVERPRVGRPKEAPLTILRRAAATDDATKWLVRLIGRKRYRRAVELADEIEAAVARLEAEDLNAYYSWNHTLARSERACWREYARILSGEDIPGAVSRLAHSGADLIALSEADATSVVFSERNELGFLDHPAYSRLLLTIAITYNSLGYGYAALGNFARATRAYAITLKYTRMLPPPSLPVVQEATTRNNLARVLVEMGKKRATRVCRDALQLRIRLGDLIPIAYSYNTLGLIANDLYQPKEAMEYCARALAIARRVDDSRLTGLVLVQLGEALRRLAKSDMFGELNPEEIYREASRALEQAQEIFQAGLAAGESIRAIEVNIETGCLYRDWMVGTDREQLPDLWQRRRHNAFDYLERASQAARRLDLRRLALDAQVNISWAYYSAGEWDSAKSSLDEAESLTPKDARFGAGSLPPVSAKHDDYLFKQLSKIFGLRGRIAFEAFFKKSREAKRLMGLPLEEANKVLLQLLEEAADYYVHALGYAELFSPRSAALTVIYDVLYDFLKKLNGDELKCFYRYQREASDKYQIGKLKPENFGDLSSFLADCFGDYYEPELEKA